MSGRKLGLVLAALALIQSAVLAEETTPSAGNRITGGQNIPVVNFPPPVGSPPVNNPTVGEMGRNSLGTFDLGVGTLIGPQQVIFSAQTITDPNTGQLINPNIGTDLRFRLNGVIYAGRAVAIHPTWFGINNPPIPAETHFDLAILILAQQVPNTIPTPLLRKPPTNPCLIGGFGYLSAAGGCGPAQPGLLPQPGTIQAATTNEIPLLRTPTFYKCTGGANSPYPPGNVVTVNPLPTGGGGGPPFPFYGDTGAPLMNLDPLVGTPQAWKIAGIATFNTPSFTCGNLATYVRLDVPAAVTFIDSFINPSAGLPPPPPKADLVITSVSLPGQPVAGQPFTFTATILNQGSLIANAFYVSAFLDNNSFVLSSTGQAASVQVLGGLSAGASTTVTLTVTWPNPGKFNLKIQADPDHNVDEADTLNNTVIVQEKVLAKNIDLNIPLIIKQSTGGVDTGFVVVIENDGLGTAGPFSLASFSNLLASPDQALSQDPTATPLPTPDLGVIIVPGLAANSSTTVAVNLPSGAGSTRSGQAWFYVNPPQSLGNSLVPLVEDVTTNNTATATWGVQTANIQLNSAVSSTNTTGNIGQIGFPVTFTVGGSATDTNNGAVPLTYKWDFGDGTSAITNSGTVTHVYSTQGTYTVTVTISAGQFSTAVSTLSFKATTNPTVTLGPVSVSAKKGRLALKLPRPSIFVKQDRVTSKLLLSDAIGVTKYSNFRLSGKITSADVGNKQFTVNYIAAKSNKQIAVTYILQIVP